MAYRTAVDAIVAAPAGSLGGSSPTHRQMHDADRAGIREIADYIDAQSPTWGAGGGTGPWRIVTGLVVNSSAAAGANTTALQAALTATATAGGGTVGVPYTLAGVLYINNTLTIGSRTTLDLNGWHLQLTFANGVSTTATPKPVIASGANTNYIGIRNVYIDGNKANQVDTNFASTGIDFYARGSTEGSGAPVYDGGLWCDNVMVYNCKGTGFYVRGTTTTMRLSRCYSYHNDGHGYWTKTDQIASDCVAANNGLNGFYCYSATSVIWNNLKGFGNGQLGAGNYADLQIAYSNTVMLTNCQAEDFSEAGIWITSSNHVQLINCHAYRGGTQGSPDGSRAGFRFEDDGAGNLCHDVIVIGDVLGGGAGGVNWALTTRNLGPDCFFHINTETLTSGTWNHLSGATDNAKFTFDNVLQLRENLQTGTAYTLTLTDIDLWIAMNNASANALTVPAHGSVPYPAGTTFPIEQRGAGQTTVTPTAGITINSAVGLKLRTQNSVAFIRKVGFPSNTWTAWGDLVP